MNFPKSVENSRIWMEQLRVFSWIKNLIIFLPAAIYAPTLSSVDFSNLLTVVVGFSALASSVYLANDLYDKERDLQHPGKKTRPISRGAISPKSAYVVSVVLSFFGLLLFLSIEVKLFVVGFLYLCANALYTLKFKRVLWINVILLALFHVARFSAGIVGGGYRPPNIDYILSFSIFFPLAIASHQEDFYLNWGYRRCLFTYVFFASVCMVFVLIYIIGNGSQLYFAKPKLLLAVLPILSLDFIRFWKVSRVSANRAYRIIPILKDRYLWFSIFCMAVVFYLAKSNGLPS